MPPNSVLLIDDDPAVLRAMGDYFERLDYEVHRAASGTEGIGSWRRLEPDVTILDLYLPDMSGMEVLETLRRPRATIIMLTGHGDIDLAVRAMQIGAENFLTKPVDMPHLGASVAKAAEKDPAAGECESPQSAEAELETAGPAVLHSSGPRRRVGGGWHVDRGREP